MRLFNEEQEKEICEKYKSGMSGIELIKSYGVSHTAIYGVLCKNGVTIRSNRFAPNNQQIQEICRNYEDGTSGPQLAKKHGTSIMTILKVLRENSVNIRSPSKRVLDEQQIKEIIGKYKNKVSATKLAKEYKTTVSTINKTLHRNGVIIRSNTSFEHMLDKKQQSDMVDLYKNGLSETKIANKYNITQGVVHKILIKHKINFRTHNISPLENKIIEIIIKYQDGTNSRVLADEYGVSNGTITKFLRRHGVPTRKYNKKYDYDEHYFDLIDTPEKAYWLGNFYADATIICNTENPQYVLRMAVAAKDRILIEKFKEAIHTNIPIYEFDKINHWKTQGKREAYTSITRQCSAYVCNKNIVYQLIDKGCGPNKTYAIRWPTPNQVPEHLLVDFMRGYFDGDGSWEITFLTRKNGSIYAAASFSILSSSEFCEEAQKWLMKKCDLNKTKLEFHNNIWRVRYDGNRQIARIYHLLYDGVSTIHLQRKKDHIFPHIQSYL